MITPATKAKIRPGIVATAIIFPRANSEFVSSKTSQLIAIRLNPNPMREIMFPMKKRKKVLSRSIFSMTKISLASSFVF